MIHFYQIYFREEQQAQFYPFAIPVHNRGLTIFFENEIIKALVPRVRAEHVQKIAVVSWKLKEKLRMYIGRPREITQELLESEYDVLSFTKNTQYHDFYAFGEAHHKGFRESLAKMLKVAGVPMPSRVKTPIYQNHFSARTDIYRDYVKTHLIPCMEAIENDPEVNKLAMMDSNYTKLAKDSAVSPEYLKEKIGIPYYPLCPFLLERLFSIYCTNRKINVTPL